MRVWGSSRSGTAAKPSCWVLKIRRSSAALAFRQVLEARGIAVAGEALARHVFPNQADDLSRACQPRTAKASSWRGASLRLLIEDLRITDKVSQNLHAEMALRAVARARRGTGSRDAGLEEMQTFLTEIGIDPVLPSPTPRGCRAWTS